MLEHTATFMNENINRFTKKRTYSTITNKSIRIEDSLLQTNTLQMLADKSEHFFLTICVDSR